MSEKKGGTFCDLFGNTPRNRVLEVFLEGREIDNSLGNVSEEGCLNRATVYNVAKTLLRQEIITQTRKIGRTQLYGLNFRSRDVQDLVKVFDFALKLVATDVKRDIKSAHPGRVKAKVG